MLEWRLMVHTKVIHAQYSVCVVDAFKLSLSCWISETWPPLETRLKSAYYCTLWDSRSISHFVVAVVKCAIEQCACEWLGLGLSFFCLWGFKLYFLIARLVQSNPRNSFLCRPCIFLFVLAFCAIYSNLTEFHHITV